MNNWLTVRTFLAFFFAILGIGVTFVRSDDQRILLGAIIASIGLTFLLRLSIALRAK